MMRAKVLGFWVRLRGRSSAESGRAAIPPGVIVRMDDSGMVLFCTRRGLIYRVNRIGVVIWNSVLQGHTRDSLATTISERFGIEANEASNHVDLFVSSLVDNRLLCHPEYPHA